MIRQASYRSARSAGFTLIELMVTIAIAAVLLMIAIPSFQGVALTSQLRTLSNDLLASARVARSEAIKRNTVVTLCPSADGQACANGGGWEQGWIIACRTTDNVNCQAAGPNWLVIQNQQAAASGMRVSPGGNVTQLRFQPTGVGATAAAFTICRASPLGSQERVVTVDATGRAWVRKTANGVCT